MKKVICFEAKKLSKMLPGYQLRRFGVEMEDEEGWLEDEARYYFCLPNVKAVKISSGAFWTSMYINLEDGTKITAESDNVNARDTNIIRISNNNFVSPKLNVNGDYVESTAELVNWLLQHGATESELKKISKDFTIYEDVEYCGVPTPERSILGGWSYSSNNLILKEQEIETVLNSIEDDLLREKIECILYARVFKKI